MKSGFFLWCITQKLTIPFREKLTELSDRELKFVFNELELNNFWFEVRNEYPELSGAALKVLLQFAESVRDNFST